eukprot:jgi/Picsp_1/4774/NSC_02142-R1_auxin efflux carrier
MNFGSVQECANVGFGYVAIGSAANQILTYPIAIYLLQNKVEDEAKNPHELGDIQEEGSISKGSTSPQSRVEVNVPGESFKTRSHSLRGAESHELVLPLKYFSTEYSGLSNNLMSPNVASTSFGSNHLMHSCSLVIVPHGHRDLAFWKSDKGLCVRLPEDNAPLGEEDGQAAFIDATEETMDLLSLDAGRTNDYMTTTFLRRRKSLAGIIVVLIPELQNLLYPIQSAALGFISGSMRSISNALVFVSSFVMGGSMSKGPGEGTKQIGLMPCVAVSFTRFVVLPSLGAVIIIGSNKLGIWTPYNPVYIIILLLQYCVPTANQMQNIASMYGNYESAMGTLIFWEYVAMLFFVPFWLCIYLILLSKFDVYASIPS